MPEDNCDLFNARLRFVLLEKRSICIVVFDTCFRLAVIGLSF